MTECKKVFLDTAPLIYFLDDDANFGEKMRCILEAVLGTDKKVVSSVITCDEYLVYPFRTNNQEKIDVFFEFTKDCNIELTPITVEIAMKAAAIRAKYEYFKPMDALQLAVATEMGCDAFLTNDKQLKQFIEIRCITVEEWEL